MKHATMIVTMALSMSGIEGAAQVRTLSVGDAVLRVESTGSGPAVVLIHGWAQDLSVWDSEVPVLANGHQVIRYDRRGYGRSTGHADPSADPADLLVLLDSLGIRQPTVIGLSAGAAVALRYAMAYPDRIRGLVLYGYAGAGLDGFPMPAHAATVPPFADILRRYGKDSLTKFVWTGPLVWRAPGSPDPLLNLPQWWNDYEGRDLLDPRPPSARVPPAEWARIPELRVPTLLINGDHDIPPALIVADSLARRLPDVRRVVIPSAGHGAHMDQPVAFRQAVQNFLARLP